MTRDSSVVTAPVPSKFDVEGGYRLVGADDQLRQELVGQGVEVIPVELGLWSCPQVRLCEIG